MSIQKELEALIVAREKAAPGKWRFSEHDDPGDDGERIYTYWVSSDIREHVLDNIRDYQCKDADDLKFMVEAANFAATAAPQLLARLKRYEEALRFYSEDHKMPSDGPWGVNSIDFGNRARRALEEPRRG